jgi:hypothetical protein
MLVAVTVKVYEVLLVRPPTMQLSAPVVAHIWPWFEVTVYAVIGAPETGGLHLTRAAPLPAVALGDCGALGAGSRVALAVAAGPSRPAVSTAATE